jgi:hypothetical protein
LNSICRPNPRRTGSTFNSIYRPNPKQKALPPCYVLVWWTPVLWKSFFTLVLF